MSHLLPDGIDHLADLPYQFFDAIRHALGFLGFDELPRDERPPRSIWMEPDLMRKHFKAVEAARDAKYGLESKNMRDEAIEGPVSDNDTAALLGIER